MIWQRQVQKGIVEALDWYEKHSLAGRRKIENGSEINTRAVCGRARLNQTQNWSW